MKNKNKEHEEDKETKDLLNIRMSKEELIKVFIEEIKRKDKIIEKLREENIILMKTAIKRAKENSKTK